MQAEFLRAGDVKYPHKDGLEFPTIEDLKLPLKLMVEEYVEFFEEISFRPSSISACKEAIDLIYVTAQYLNQLLGPDKANTLFNAVHKNNMSKCIKGVLVKREDGKIMKPEGFDKQGWLKDYDNECG
jgi:hypothetical protein